MQPLVTERLILSEFTLTDAPFILALLNDADFIRFIGDKGVRSIPDAENYLSTGPLLSYQTNGFGLWKVTTKDNSQEPIGMCGLIRREALPCLDVGYAFIPLARKMGYASEAALACKKVCFSELNHKQLAGIVNSDNPGSIKVLTNLGMQFIRTTRMPGADHDVDLYMVEKGDH